jgi:hypothetical protein
MSLNLFKIRLSLMNLNNQNILTFIALKEKQVITKLTLWFFVLVYDK